MTKEMGKPSKRLKHDHQPQFSLSSCLTGDQVSSIMVSALKHVISGSGGNVGDDIAQHFLIPPVFSAAATSSSPIKSSTEFEQAERVPLFLPEADKCGLCEIDGCLGCNLFGASQPKKKIMKKNSNRSKLAAERLGTFDTARAYDKAAISFRGDSAKINFPFHDNLPDYNSKSHKAVKQLQREEPKSVVDEKVSAYRRWPPEMATGAGPTASNRRDSPKDFWDMLELEEDAVQGWTMMLNVPGDLPTTTAAAGVF